MGVILTFLTTYDHPTFDQSYLIASFQPQTPDCGPFHPSLGDIPRSPSVQFTLDKDDSDTATFARVLEGVETRIRTYRDPPSIRAHGARAAVEEWRDWYEVWFREWMLPTLEIMTRMYAHDNIIRLNKLTIQRCLPKPFPFSTNQAELQAVAKLMLGRRISAVFEEFHRRWTLCSINYAARICLTYGDWQERRSGDLALFEAVVSPMLSHLPEVDAEIKEMFATASRRMKAHSTFSPLKLDSNSKGDSSTLQEAPSPTPNSPVMQQDLVKS